MKYEYAVTKGRGTLIDYGCVTLVALFSGSKKFDFQDGWYLTYRALDDQVNCQTGK